MTEQDFQFSNNVIIEQLQLCRGMHKKRRGLRGERGSGKKFLRGEV